MVGVCKAQGGSVRCCSSYTGAAAAVCGMTRTDGVEEKGKGPADNDTITNRNPNWSRARDLLSASESRL